MLSNLKKKKINLFILGGGGGDYVSEILCSSNEKIFPLFKQNIIVA